MTRNIVGSGVTAAAIMAAGLITAVAQSGETFIATASVKTPAGVTVNAPLEITITGWTSDAERDKAVAALKGGQSELKAVLDKAPALGTIKLGERTTPVKFARALTTGSGRVITVVASQPVLHLGAGVPDAKPRTGYEFSAAVFEVDAAGRGTGGDLAPAAKLAMTPEGSLRIDDYGIEAVRFAGIKKK